MKNIQPLILSLVLLTLTCITPLMRGDSTSTCHDIEIDERSRIALHSAVMATAAAVATVIILQKNNATTAAQMVTACAVALGVFTWVKNGKYGVYVVQNNPAPEYSWASTGDDEIDKNNAISVSRSDNTFTTETDSLSNTCNASCEFCPPAAVFLS